MKCPRCQGLVVKDQFYDLNEPDPWTTILRCLNCGDVTFTKPGEADAERKSREEKPAIQVSEVR